MRYQKVILFSLAIITGVVILSFFLRTSPPKKQSDSATNSISSADIISLLPQINSEGPVTVKVTPKNISQSTTSWDFEILLDTHSQSLDQDLVKASILIDDTGNQFKPTGWEVVPVGEVEPPQEHHRQGILKFPPLTPRPKSIELKILNIGDINERSFKWEL